MNEFQAYGIELAKEKLTLKFKYDNIIDWGNFNSIFDTEYEKLLVYCGIIGDSLCIWKETPNDDKDFRVIYSNDKIFDIEINEVFNLSFSLTKDNFFKEYNNTLLKQSNIRIINSYKNLPENININDPEVFTSFMNFLYSILNNLRYIEFTPYRYS